MRSAISACRNAAQMLASDAEKPGVTDLAELLRRAADVAERIATGERDIRLRIALANAVSSLSMAERVPSTPPNEAAGPSQIAVR